MSILWTLCNLETCKNYDEHSRKDDKFHMNRDEMEDPLPTEKDLKFKMRTHLDYDEHRKKHDMSYLAPVLYNVSLGTEKAVPSTLYIVQELTSLVKVQVRRTLIFSTLFHWDSLSNVNHADAHNTTLLMDLLPAGASQECSARDHQL